MAEATQSGGHLRPAGGRQLRLRHRCAELYRWYTTGELLTRFDSGTRWAHWQLVTFDSHPFNFIVAFAIDASIAALGLAACVMHYLIIRKWWNNKPKPVE